MNVKTNAITKYARIIILPAISGVFRLFSWPARITRPLSNFLLSSSPPQKSRFKKNFPRIGKFLISCFYLITTKLLTIPEATRYTFGIYGLSFRASLLWNQLPKKLKLHDIQTLAKFKTEIKRWKGCKCSCNICR